MTFNLVDHWFERYPAQLFIVLFNEIVLSGLVGSVQVVSATNERWDVIPDYIGDGIGDQGEIMEAICAAIGQGVNGIDCDGVEPATTTSGVSVSAVPKVDRLGLACWKGCPVDGTVCAFASKVVCVV